jgi:hypothetical protein
MNLVSLVSEDSVTFAAKKCDYSSNAYYCQPAKAKKKPVVEEEEPEPEEPPMPKRPPMPKGGEDYDGFRCVTTPISPYTGMPGLNGTCGHFKDVSEEDCIKACDESSSALGKESCDKKTGVPNCVASVYDRKNKICILHRECPALEKWEGHEDIVTRLKADYNPMQKPFERTENVICKGEPFTGPDGDRMGFKDSSEMQCWEACFANKWSGEEDVPLEKCSAAAYHAKTKYCDLYKHSECKSTKKKEGVITFKKLESPPTKEKKEEGGSEEDE